MPLFKKDTFIMATIIIIGAVILTILYFQLYKPTALQLKTVTNELATEQRLLELIENKKVDEDSKTLETTEVLQRKIPVKSMSDQFLLDIENAKTETGIQIKEILFSDSPIASEGTGEEVDQGTDQEEASTDLRLPNGIQRLTVDMNVETINYFAFEDFLTKMQELERIVNIEGVSFIAPENETAPITFEIKVSAYYMPGLQDLIDDLPQVAAPKPANKINPFD